MSISRIGRLASGRMSPVAAYDRAVLNVISGGPLFYLPLLDEPVAGQVRDLTGHTTPTVGGGLNVQATDNVPPFSGAKTCPTFTAADTTKVITIPGQFNGLTSWTIALWVAVADFTADCAFCCEQGTTGTDKLYVGSSSGVSWGLQSVFNFQDDVAASQAVLKSGSKRTKPDGNWFMVVTQRYGDNARVVVNAGQDVKGTLGGRGSAFTNTGLKFGVGATPRGGTGLTGQVCRVAAWNSVPMLGDGVTPDNAWISRLYGLGAPGTRVRGMEPVRGTFFHPNSYVNKKLPRSPAPPVDPNSASIITANAASFTNAIAQTDYSTRIHDVDEHTPTQRVRVSGGRYANSRLNKELLWQDLGQVPVPPQVDRAAGGSEKQITFVLRRPDGRVSIWDFIGFYKNLGLSTVAAPTISVSASGGSLTAMSGVLYAISAYTGKGEGAHSTVSGGRLTIAAGSKVTVTGTQLPEQPRDAEDQILGFHLWRQVTSSGMWQIVGSAPYPTITNWNSSKVILVDDGTVTPSGDRASLPDYTNCVATNDWVCLLGGYYDDLRQNVGYFDSYAGMLSDFDQGGTASRIPKMCGVTTIREAQSGTIPHVLCASVPNPSTVYNYPAHDTDGGNTSSSALREGDILFFDQSIDPQSVLATAGPLGVMFLSAMQDHGLLLMDQTSSGIAVFVEPDYETGRDWWTELTGGVGLANAIAKLPWSTGCRVLDRGFIAKRNYRTNTLALDGMIANYKADIISGLNDGDPVTTWKDITGFAPNAAAVSGVDTPVLKQNVLNGRQVVRFDQSTVKALEMTGLVLAQPFTWIVVARSSDTSVFNALLVPPSGSTKAQMYINFLRLVMNAGTFVSPPTALANDGWYGLCGSFTGATSQYCLLPGMTVTANAATGTNGIPGGDLRIGNGGGSVTNAAVVDIAEVVILNRAMTNADVPVLAAYLAAEYGIS